VDARDELAALAAERAALEAELAIFAAEYERRVGRLLAELHRLDPHLPGRRSRRRRRARRAARERAAEATPPQADLKRLFRDAAKRMHPDLAADAEHRSHAEAFMKRLNESYRAGDGRAIEDLIAQWDDSPYSRPSGEERTETRAAGEARVASAVERARRELDALRATDLAVLMEDTMAAAAEGRDHLAELQADAEAALAAARARAKR
jgi:hypothetical protein